MKLLSIAILIFFSVGCAPADDTAYDLSLLPEDMQDSFSAAMNWWNEKQGEIIFRTLSASADSYAYLGKTKDGKSANFKRKFDLAKNEMYGVIVFSDEIDWYRWDDLPEFQKELSYFECLAKHELGHHIIGSGHSTKQNNIMYAGPTVFTCVSNL